MRWPWQRRETRQSGGDFSDAVVRLIESQAAGQAADASSTAAVEAASGALSRAFSAATVDGPPWTREAVSPAVLGQMGRDLIRRGQSLHVIRLDAMGGVQLIPASSWHFEGSHDPASWTVRATCYGPSTSTTWNLPASGVVFLRWGSAAGQPYIGTAPVDWAHTTARLNAAAEKTLADEAGGPVASLLTVPEGAGGDEDCDGDPLATLRASITGAKGKALILESTSGGYGQGRTEAPKRDWIASRLGPDAPLGQIALAKDAFARVLAACGASPAMWDDSDGTAKREALRQFYLGTVQPLARMLETELSAKLDAEIRLGFDLYNVDLAGRAQAFQKLVGGGVSVSEALVTAGLLVGVDD